jgi:hypothetical protein
MEAVYFLGEKCFVDKLEYSNGRTALRLYTVTDGFKEPMGTATVNIPDAPLNDDEVFIKNYSENKGILKALIKAGIVEDTGRMFPVGHTFANICKLLI